MKIHPIRIQFVLLLSITVALSCENDILVSKQDIAEFREIAWNYLTHEEKSQVTGDWRNAEGHPGKYNGQFAVWVTFPSDSFLGPITIIISRDSKEVIGTLPRL